MKMMPLSREESDSSLASKSMEKLEKYEEDTDLSYHVALIQLLAACAEGENSDTAVKCQGLLLLEDISCVLIHATTSIEVKAAYVDFVTNVYAPAELEINEVANSPLVFSIFENFVADLNEVLEAGFEDLKFKTPGISMLEYLSEHVSKCLTAFFTRSNPIRIPSLNSTQYTTVISIPPSLCTIFYLFA